MAVIEKVPDLFEIVNDADSLRRIVGSGNVVVAYMTDWCGPCRRNIHEFYYNKERIKHEIEIRKLKLVYVDPDFVAPVHEIVGVPSYFAHGMGGVAVGSQVGKIAPNEFIELLKKWYDHPVIVQP